MIDKDCFSNLLYHPTHIEDVPLNQIETLMQQFPYFNLAYLLYAHKLRIESIAHTPKLLNKLSLNIPNRAELFAILNPEYGKAPSPISTEEVATEKGEAAEQPAESKTVKSETTLEHQDKAVVEQKQSDYQAIDHRERSSSLQEGLDAASITQQIELSLKGKTDKQLIQSFIQDNNLNEQESQEFTKPDPSESFEPNGVFLTETLANIYIKQKKYDRAVNIFKGLISLHPEKKVYFAEKIDEIEKLIQ